MASCNPPAWASSASSDGGLRGRRVGNSQPTPNFAQIRRLLGVARGPRGTRASRAARCALATEHGGLRRNSGAGGDVGGSASQVTGQPRSRLAIPSKAQFSAAAVADSQQIYQGDLKWQIDCVAVVLKICGSFRIPEKRRGWDSNPRKVALQTISSRSLSTTQPPLQVELTLTAAGLQVQAGVHCTDRQPPEACSEPLSPLARQGGGREPVRAEPLIQRQVSAAPPPGCRALRSWGRG